MLYQIVAMANDRVIGKDGKLPWHFPADLKHFKKLTTGHTLIMGRKTFESIGKPLPGRENFVLTRNNSLDQVGVQFFSTLQDALDHVLSKNCFIIGGAGVYRETLGCVEGIYLTRIHSDYDGDTYYPVLPSSFVEKSRETIQDVPRLEVIYYENNTKNE